MEEKCFCHFNGYEVKDAYARNIISVLKDKKFVFIGDSYGAGWTPDGNTTPYQEIIREKFGLVTGENFWTNNLGGAAFHKTDEYSFLELLKGLENSIASKEAITDIFVLGGHNDYLSINDPDGIKNGIKNFCDYAKENYANAKIHIGMIGWTIGDNHVKRLDKVQRIYSSCCDFGYGYIANSEVILHDCRLFASDGYHPTQEGQNELARYLCGYMINGNIDVIKESAYTTLNLSDDARVSVSTTLHNNVMTMCIYGFSTETTFPKTALVLPIAGYLTNVANNECLFERFPVTVFDGAKFYDTWISVCAQDGYIKFTFTKVTEEGQSYIEHDNISRIQGTLVVSIPSIYC